MAVAKRIITNSSKKSLKILELGVGSGCLIISVFLESKNKSLTGLGVDISDGAINLAKKNLNKDILYIDTLNIAKYLMKNQRSFKLSSLCKYYNINLLNSHRAMGDVYALEKLYNLFINLDNNIYLKIDIMPVVRQ